MPETRTFDTVLQDLHEHPEAHKHTDLAALNSCCFINGAIEIALVDAHSQLVDMGTNGGVRCDVKRGPCACGAWH